MLYWGRVREIQVFTVHAMAMVCHSGQQYTYRAYRSRHQCHGARIPYSKVPESRCNRETTVLHAKALSPSRDSLYFPGTRFSILYMPVVVCKSNNTHRAPVTLTKESSCHLHFMCLVCTVHVQDETLHHHLLLLLPHPHPHILLFGAKGRLRGPISSPSHWSLLLNHGAAFKLHLD